MKALMFLGAIAFLVSFIFTKLKNMILLPERLKEAEEARDYYNQETEKMKGNYYNRFNQNQDKYKKEEKDDEEEDFDYEDEDIFVPEYLDNTKSIPQKNIDEVHDNNFAEFMKQHADTQPTVEYDPDFEFYQD